MRGREPAGKHRFHRAQSLVKTLLNNGVNTVFAKTQGRSDFVGQDKQHGEEGQKTSPKIRVVQAIGIPWYVGRKHRDT